MDVWHFALNMIAFSSFAGAAMSKLGGKGGEEGGRGRDGGLC